jgi:hypothetical protein
MVTMPVRARLRFAEHVFPSPTPIRTWEGFWQFLESLPGRRQVVRPTGDDPNMRAYARVDEGRWVADCPWRCGAAFNLPSEATWLWCTECAGGGQGMTAVLVWPDPRDRLVANLESLPSLLQFWPCAGCLPKMAAGLPLCSDCRGLQGGDG